AGRRARGAGEPHGAPGAVLRRDRRLRRARRHRRRDPRTRERRARAARRYHPRRRRLPRLLPPPHPARQQRHLHNSDIYPPTYEPTHAVSYIRTDLPVTVPERMQPADQATWGHRLAYRVITSGTIGKWIRQHIIDPLMFRGNPVTWRNYEASYDVS